MPKYNPSSDEMDDTYGAPVTPPKKTSEEQESVDQENAEADTAIISNKILSPEGEPLNPGDEIVVQVVKNYGDESEVKYAPHKPGEEDEDEEPSSDKMMSDAGNELAAMDNPKY